MKRSTKAAVALVSAVALVILSATPSAAATSTGPATAGTLTLDTASAIQLNGGGTCAAATAVATNGTLTPPYTGTLSVSVTQGVFTYGGSPFVFTGTFNLAYTLTANPSHPDYTITGTMTLANGRIWTRTSTTSCTPVTSACIPVLSSGGITSSTFTAAAGTTDVLPPIGTAVIDRTATISAFGCAAPLSILNGKLAVMNDMTLVLT
ncbi:MAG TPA: hypothetical protein VF228_24340 [Iamia sp.]